MARAPKRKTGPRARPSARPRRYTRKPGTNARQPMSGYGAARRNPGKSAAQGATNFSPEPTRIGRDAMVTPQVISSNYNMETGQHDRYVVDTLRPVTTSDHFEYGRQGRPGPNASEWHRQMRRENAAQNRRDRAARMPRARAGELRRRAR